MLATVCVRVEVQTATTSNDRHASSMETTCWSCRFRITSCGMCEGAVSVASSRVVQEIREKSTRLCVD
ncbi:MAG: hypothetical protein ACK56I_16585, partial [bacterium]